MLTTHSGEMVEDIHASVRMMLKCPVPHASRTSYKSTTLVKPLGMKDLISIETLIYSFEEFWHPLVGVRRANSGESNKYVNIV